MEIFTSQEFQENFDDLIKRVENGEHFGIIDENGKASVIVPTDADLVKIYMEHNEAP
jgi:antitoxin (DNA-binding transcriptional repressor) of toxin-antitoxin stability system